MKIKIIFFILSLLTHALTLNAAPRCETSLFGPRPEKVMESITSKLSQFDYSIEGTNIFKTVNGFKTQIGTTEIIQPRFLFEWQDEDYHDEYVKQKKFSKGDMDYALSIQGQSYGRGFYVSLSPTDSMSYGSHLTVFETKAPLIILKNFNRTFQEDEKTLNELRQIGFAGLRCTDTWLNIFNENYLNDAKRITKSMLDQFLLPHNNVPAFHGARLMLAPSIAKLISTNYTLQGLFKKISGGQALGPSEKSYLRSEFTNNSVQLIKHLKLEKNDAALFQTIVNSLTIDDLVALNRGPEQSDLKYYIADAFEQIPVAGVFFTLYDLLDVATIGSKKISDPITYNEMKKESLKYLKGLQQTDMRKIKTAGDFKSTLKKMFGFDFTVRNYEQYHSSMQKGHGNPIIGNVLLQNISKNNFLTVHKGQVTRNEAMHIMYETEINYFGLDTFSSTKSLFKSTEYQQIQDTLGNSSPKASEEKAIRLAINLLLEKFFDPTQFANIAQAMGEKVSALTIYKAFVSLQPFAEGNIRSADFYYRWLVTNHFPKESAIFRSPLKESDLFLDENSFYSNYDQNWNLMRLWVLSADNEKVMIERAKTVLNKDSRHSFFTDALDDVKALTK